MERKFFVKKDLEKNPAQRKLLFLKYPGKNSRHNRFF